MPRFGDLHLHTHYSDGEKSVSEICAMAISENLSFIALTEHDTLDHLQDEYLIQEQQLEIINAIEITAYEGNYEYHIIGYLIKPDNLGLTSLIQTMKAYRDNKIKTIIANLNRIGIDISFAEVRKISQKGFYSRNHIAQILLSRGYIKTLSEAFSNKFIGNNSEAYVRGLVVPPEQVITAIHEAGGVAILAHPGNNPGINRDFSEKDAYIFKSKDLDGLEVFQPKHSSEQIKNYLKIAKKFDFLVTGGSDYHGWYSPDIFIGSVKLPEKYLSVLKNSI